MKRFYRLWHQLLTRCQPWSDVYKPEQVKALRYRLTLDTSGRVTRVIPPASDEVPPPLLQCISKTIQRTGFTCLREPGPKDTELQVNLIPRRRGRR